MKSEIFSVMRRMTTTPSEDILHGMVVGFMAGLAFARTDPLLAISIDRKLRAEWSSDLNNPVLYGPEEMARMLSSTLGEE